MILRDSIYQVKARAIADTARTNEDLVLTESKEGVLQS